MALPPTSFAVEQYVRLPKGGDVKCYLNGEGRTGPMWRAGEGKFQILDGDESGGGRWTDTKIACQDDTWHKVTVTVDVASRRWQFTVDGKKYDGKPIGFRTKPSNIQEISYLTETRPGVYIDAVRFLKSAPTKKGPEK
jgi:hypothetical protein